MLRAAAAAAFVALVVSTAALAHASSGPRVLVVGGEIGRISASGSRVAFTTSGGRCGRAFVWNEATGALTALKDPCTSDYTFSDLTLAGGTALWWDYSTGNHVYCDDVYGNGRALGLCSGGEGDTYFEFTGDDSLAAVVDYSVCEADCTGENGELLPDGDYGVEVRRLKAGKVVPLLKPVDFRAFLDARNWRVATIEPKATLTVYDASGKRLWSRPGVTGVYGGWIDGSSVVLQQPQTLRVYSPAGAGIERPLPKGARVQSVVGGLALYAAGSTVHILRIADGHDRSLVTVKGVVGAQLTPAGAFYAAGRSLKFMAMHDVLRKLR